MHKINIVSMTSWSHLHAIVIRIAFKVLAAQKHSELSVFQSCIVVPANSACFQMPEI